MAHHPVVRRLQILADEQGGRVTQRKGCTDRVILRAIERLDERVEQIIEQDVPANAHQVGLFLRRDPFRSLATHALLRGGVVTLEVRKK
jgi:hypothetical protein